ncbi:hypothetical protein RRG08_024586 [Elysia crispata]|uniref:Uncharacterized protein n=1 Tax=Elysia crispata TaxID=231223 RepID=A0AAE0ZWH8_9GAST|nr:hypothetical protein RRG08_024586 [Elysia crispata]
MSLKKRIGVMGNEVGLFFFPLPFLYATFAPALYSTEQTAGQGNIRLSASMASGRGVHVGYLGSGLSGGSTTCGLR